MAIIEVNHVTKEFRLGVLHSFRQTMLNTLSRLRGETLQKRPMFKALDNVDFKVEEGEVLGIIGHNGAGKSTLLKMLSQISTPTHGSVKVKGKVAPLIEVGAGLIGDLTGRENIFLNGAILGIPKTEINKKFDDIVAFAELEEFIDTPIKRYSSGMQVRLGFSVATSVDADILIVDEVLAVGDLAFQRKCFDRMEDMIKRQGKTVLLVSHNIRQVERLCSRVLLMEEGRVIENGEPTRVCNTFYDQNNAKIRRHAIQDKGGSRLVDSDELAFRSVDIIDQEGHITSRVQCLAPMRIRLRFNALAPLKGITFYIGIHTTDFVYLTANNTAHIPVDYPVGEHWVELDIASMTLLPGIYCLLVWIGTSVGKVYFHGENLLSFQIASEDFTISRQSERGVCYLEGNWVLDRTISLPIGDNLSITNSTEFRG